MQSLASITFLTAILSVLVTLIVAIPLKDRWNVPLKPRKGSVTKYGDDCADPVYESIGDCYTKIIVCYGFYDWQWQYQATASTNGTTGPTTPHYDSSDGAAYHAIQSLFELLPNGNSNCNCAFINNYQVAKCTLDIEECFRFNSSTDVEDSKPDFFAWVTPVDDTNVSGFYCCDYNETLAAEYAIKNLEQKDFLCFL